jgi:PRTase ComF-like
MSLPAPAWPVASLHVLYELPLDPGFPLFQHYPPMKLGVRESVREYARLLLPLAREVISRRPESAGWVITAPPFFAAPAGANLVAREIHRHLTVELPSHLSLRMMDLRLPVPTGAALEDVRAGDYSRKGVEARIADRRQLFVERTQTLDPAVFRGRAVLFVNDINVTGTQQSFMQRAFEAVGPASVDWIYIIQVDPRLGRSNPELEHALNHLRLGTFEAFAEVVAQADIDYTCRCVRRLITCPAAQLEPLFRALDDTRRRRLHDLATREGIYTGEDDVAKLALLREHFGAKMAL